MNICKSAAISALKRVRIGLNNRGFDVHPLDQRCWDDQAALIAGSSKPVIFDVGANCGTVTDKYKAMFPDSTVYSFEPQPEMVAQLTDRFGNDKTVFINAAAVGKREGKTQLHVNASRDTSSLLPSDDDALSPSYRSILKTDHILDVETITIDGFASNRSIPRIDILKMDIQGGELEALEGSSGLLGRRAIGVIYSEVFFVPMYIGQPLFGDICEYLARSGYTVHLLYNQMLNGRTGRPLQADCLFVSPDLRPLSRELLRTWFR